MIRLLLATVVLIGSAGLAYGQLDPGDAYRMNQAEVNGAAKTLTPEQRDAAAIKPKGMESRAWRWVKMGLRASRPKNAKYETTVGTLVKIYPDSVVIQTGKRDDDSTEIKKRCLSKEDQALVVKIMREAKGLPPLKK